VTERYTVSLTLGPIYRRVELPAVGEPETEYDTFTASRSEMTAST